MDNRELQEQEDNTVSLKFENRWNMGHLVVIVSTLFGGGIAWASVNASIEALAKEQAAMVIDFEEIKEGYENDASRIAVLEQTSSRVDERLTWIGTTLVRIETALNREISGQK